jgi:hypothetical protein
MTGGHGDAEDTEMGRRRDTEAAGDEVEIKGTSP